MQIKLEFKKEYFWIGVHWERSIREILYKLQSRLDIWICVLPCFPIHIVRVTTVRDYSEEAKSKIPIHTPKIDEPFTESQIMDLVHNADKVNSLKRKVNR